MKYRYTTLGHNKHGALFFTNAVTTPLDPTDLADQEVLPVWIGGLGLAWKGKVRKPGTMDTFTPYSSPQRTRDLAVEAAIELARANIWD